MKLRTYGLVLTPEGRIVSTRPTLLGDGHVVGWKDNDLAAMDLGSWGADATVRPMQVAPPLPKPVRLPTPVRLASPVEEPEDDWEWEIALARARAAAEEIETAVMAAATPERRRGADTVPPPQLLATPVANKTEPLPSMDEPTETFSKTEDPPEIVRVVRIQDRPYVLPTPVAVPRTMPRASSPVTVIPVPKLPNMRSTTMSSYRPEPVVRSSPPPIPARRVAKGTGPVGDQTSPGLAIGMDNDPTRPSLTLPRTNRTMPLPAVKGH
ncbi:MAG TPA: hypothetical protein VGO00_29870 [Kofleriaceae bacterium]|nr:hypothetical protein [Kofleriaceae bacterium]